LVSGDDSASLDDFSQKKLGSCVTASPRILPAKTVPLFERYPKGGDDPKLKDWAGKTLPPLQYHLEIAQAMDKNRK
jgi:putative membrane protein